MAGQQREPPQSDAWHLDKRVPIALVLSLAAQTIGIVWSAASMSGRVDDHGRRIVSLESADQRIAAEAARVSETLARVDERLALQTQLLREIRERVAR
jgi:hypothetical protein